MHQLLLAGVLLAWQGTGSSDLEHIDPEPKAGEVRIRVHASGVNFADIMARLGLYQDAPPLPCVVGYEVSGVVDAVGAGVVRTKPGDRVIGALDKLMRQFAREERLRAWAVETAAEGSLLLVAWHGAGDLSGCSRDKLNQVLADQEQRGPSRLLTAPPIVCEIAGGPRCVDRAGLRALLAAGKAGPETPVYERFLSDLGAWRREGRRLLRESSLARLLPS